MYSIKSDVWSFGVVCYEVFTRGSPPYGDMDAVNVAMAVVHEGLRLSIPPNATPIIGDIMRQCFETDPANRPTFKYIVNMVNSKYNFQEKIKHGIQKCLIFFFNGNQFKNDLK